MSKQQIVKNLIFARELIDKTLSQIDQVQDFSSIKKVKSKGTKSLSDFLLDLRQKDFFKQAKIPKEVQSKLQSVYPCDLNRIEVALVRLRIAKKLRKTNKIIDERKLTAYVW